MRVRLLALLACLLVAVLLPLPVRAAPPADFQTSLVVGAGLDGPTGFEIAPDGRIFVLERAGTVKIVKNGLLLPTPFADLPSEPSGDRGLIGIAFDPEFGVTNHYVYFYYTGLDLRNRLVRFNASGDVGTEGPFTIFHTQSLSQQLHVGGSIRFGPDGKMYFAVGDNGFPSNAQDLTNPHGKILRINKDGSIPADNPFYGQAGKEQAIWAYGFRNPWRFQFDTATGFLYGGDVGNYTWEEINRIVKGANYGWPVQEGVCTSGCGGYTDPIHAYHHSGASAAVTGGPVYRGGNFPAAYRGSLFFGDYAKNVIRRAVLSAAGTVTAVHDFDTAAGPVVDLKEAPDGSLYYLTYLPGRLYRISYELGNHSPSAQAVSDVTKGQNPLTVRFDGSGSTDPDGDPLTYAWDFGDGTTGTGAKPVKTYDRVGVYTVSMTVSDGQGHTSSAVPIVIQVGIPPTVTVAVPADESSYRAGDTITYNAFAIDGAGFDLDDKDIRTTVLLHHGTHTHPFAGPLIGRAGSFTIPVTGETAADTWYGITVTATDSSGLSTSKTIEIRPITAPITVTTDPPGLTAQLDGIPVRTPHQVQGVSGFHRELYAPPTATGPDGRVHHFTGWSDGGGIRHTITTPDTARTYTATYAPSPSFTATFFNNTTLAGTPALTRSDPAVDFVWALGSPGAGVRADEFSARWTKRQYFAAGRYRFTTVSDDGVRLYIDRKLVIDSWVPQSGSAHEWIGDLSAGNHTVTMEYYEGGGDALAKLAWTATTDQAHEQFTAEYWNTPGAGSAPAIPRTPPNVTRPEPAVDHDWGTGSPDPTITGEHFAARWTRRISLAPGEYEFTTTADDGVRLSVDGLRVIDAWADSGATTRTARTVLGGGPHTIVMEYYENCCDAVAKLSWRQTADPVDPPAWHAEYWNSTTPAVPARAPDLVRQDPALTFDWGTGSPAPAITADDFVARWTRTDTLPAGVYRFSGLSDDGLRIFVDGAPVVDRWFDQHAAFSTDRILLAGPHEIRIEYFENGGDAVAQFGYQRIADAGPTEMWAGEYFGNVGLTGAPLVTRDTDAVDFDWGAGSPDPRLPADNFSARWTRTSDYAAGTYRLSATADDGVRVRVDGRLVIDAWRDQAPTTYTADVVLTAGEHTVVVEYYEHGVAALVRFRQTLI
ncbi:PA14 domain-containing protein [Catenuloplanes sp. NPDC051500]|uniref:PA14 domain-containing protein n=1 Tax=Catenuloplanes sp. NPDC051500 TaxID=3363959 RepID=UPI003798AE2D